jgi:hypothetical protein
MVVWIRSLAVIVAIIFLRVHDIEIKGFVRNQGVNEPEKQSGSGRKCALILSIKRVRDKATRNGSGPIPITGKTTARETRRRPREIACCKRSETGVGAGLTRQMHERIRH